MKKTIIMLVVAAFITPALYSQEADTTKRNDQDTLVAGNFIIIKNNKEKRKHKDDDNDGSSTSISFHSRKNRSENLRTSWGIVDIGFANIRDNSNYGDAHAKGYLYAGVDENSFDLITGKSSNINVWIFMQKLNLVKHVVHLEYGLGLEMYNLFYSSNINYENNPAPHIFMDSINFSKNKLALNYLTCPIMLNVTTNPRKTSWSFNFSAGISIGYLYNSHDKQKSDQRGKDKTHGNFNLDPWHIAAIGELAYGPVRLFGTYSLNSIYKTDKTGLKQMPYSFGFRLGTEGW